MSFYKVLSNSMAKNWEPIGEDKWKLTVSPDGGGPASIYYGTRDDILEKLADAQANALNGVLHRRIAENPPLGNSTVVNGNGHNPPPSDLKPMTANDRMQAVADLSNPATVDKAVTRVMESVIGPVDTFKRDREAERIERIERAAVAAVEEFCSLTPAYLPSDYNNNTLVGYMRNLGLDPTSVASYQRAWNELSGAKLLQPKSEQVQDDDEPTLDLHRRIAENPPRPAPTRYSTGVRSSDISGSPPVPTRRLKFSREQIQNMSAAEYKSHINDPEFARAVEFYSKPQRRSAVAV